MANQVDILHTGMGLDTRDWASFTKALRKAAPDTAASLRMGLRAAGKIVADRAVEIISPDSSSIPPSIKVRIAGAGVSVVAGGAGVPLAGLFEEGNQGKKGGDSTFRHPVFGNRNVWVDQDMHPFLQPAMEDKIAEVEGAVTETLNKAIDEVTK